MSKDKLLPISIFTLALSMVISASLISNAIYNNGINISSRLSQGADTINNAINNSITYEKFEKSNINFQEAAVYLGISESELMTLINDKESNIPHVKIGGRDIFNKEALDKWVGGSSN